MRNGLRPLLHRRRAAPEPLEKLVLLHVVVPRRLRLRGWCRRGVFLQPWPLGAKPAAGRRRKRLAKRASCWASLHLCKPRSVR
jgi:hypothetical protein